MIAAFLSGGLIDQNSLEQRPEGEEDLNQNIVVAKEHYRGCQRFRGLGVWTSRLDDKNISHRIWCASRTWSRLARKQTRLFVTAAELSLAYRGVSTRLSSSFPTSQVLPPLQT